MSKFHDERKVETYETVGSSGLSDSCRHPPSPPTNSAHAQPLHRPSQSTHSSTIVHISPLHSPSVRPPISTRTIGARSTCLRPKSRRLRGTSICNSRTEQRPITTTGRAGRSWKKGSRGVGEEYSRTGTCREAEESTRMAGSRREVA